MRDYFSSGHLLLLAFRGLSSKLCSCFELRCRVWAKAKRKLVRDHEVQWPGEEKTWKRVRRFFADRVRQVKDATNVLSGRITTTNRPKRWRGLFHRNENSFVKCENALHSCEIYNPCAYTIKNPNPSLTVPWTYFRFLEVGALLFYNLCRWKIPLVHY